MQDQNLPHIIVTFPDNFPEQIMERYKGELNTDRLKLEVHRLPFGGPYMTMEWAIPTLIGVYLLKPYFDGFLKEMAKDHYGVLKGWLKKLASDIRGVKVTTIAASQSTDKLTSSNTQSKVFSIETLTNEGNTLKFLFDNNFDKESWEKAIDNVLVLLNEHFTDGENDELTIEIRNNKLGRTIYAKLKSDSGEWEFLDYKTMLQ